MKKRYMALLLVLLLAALPCAALADQCFETIYESVNEMVGTAGVLTPDLSGENGILFQLDLSTNELTLVGANSTGQRTRATWSGVENPQSIPVFYAICATYDSLKALTDGTITVVFMTSEDGQEIRMDNSADVALLAQAIMSVATGK